MQQPVASAGPSDTTTLLTTVKHSELLKQTPGAKQELKGREGRRRNSSKRRRKKKKKKKLQQSHSRACFSTTDSDTTFHQLRDVMKTDAEHPEHPSSSAGRKVTSYLEKSSSPRRWLSAAEMFQTQSLQICDSGQKTSRSSKPQTGRARSGLRPPSRI